MSTPSIKIEPCEGSIILRRDKKNVDLPEPVLPTMPTYFHLKSEINSIDTFSPELIETLRLLIT